MKDPAFLFYRSDFLSGVTDLTMEERGQYISLLCLQHQKGALNEKTIRLSVGSVSVDVLAKFLKDENGNYYNERLKVEIEKRNNFTESRRNNGSKGGRPPKNDKPYDEANKNHMDMHMGNHMGNENENENRKDNKKKDIDFTFCENSELKPILIRWLEYKKWKGQRYKGQDSVETMFKKLCEYSNNDPTMATEIIEDAIAKNYTGFFKPTKITQNGNTKKDEGFKTPTHGGFSQSATDDFFGITR